MVVSSIVSSSLSPEPPAVEAESKTSSLRNEFASLVQRGGPNLASRVSADASNRQQNNSAFEQKGRNDLADTTAKTSRDAAKTKPQTESRSERTKQRTAEQCRSEENSATPRDSETRTENRAENLEAPIPETAILSPLPLEMPLAVPDMPAALLAELPTEGEALPDALFGVAPEAAQEEGGEASPKAAERPSLAMERGDAASAKPEGALSIPVTLLPEEDETFELPLMTDKQTSTQAQAQADALARTLDPNAGAIRITVTDQKASVFTTQQQSSASQTIAALAGLAEDTDGDGLDFANQQQSNGGNGQQSNGSSANAHLSPAAQAAASGTVQSQLGVSAATAFTVPTMADAAANGTGMAAQPQAGTLPGADAALAKDALSAPTTLGGEGADKVGVSGTGSTFSDMARSAARNEAPPQPYTSRPVVQSSPDQVHVHIRRAFGGGADRITIQLRPAELGRIDVRIETTSDGKVTAHVQADKLETLDMMARDARALEQALKDAGLQADRDSLNFSLRGEDRQQAEGNRDNEGRRSGGNAGNANEEDNEAAVRAAARTDGFAADGSLDIHV